MILADWATEGSRLHEVGMNPIQVLAASNTRISFDSNFTPLIPIYDPLTWEDPTNPLAALFLSWFKPTVVVHGPLVNQKLAPYGVANRDFSVVGMVLLGAFMGFATYGIYELVREV